MFLRIPSLFLAVTLFAASGCRTAPQPVVHSGSSQRYHLTGVIVSVSPSTGELTVRHGDIPGFMPAMTMPYKVQDSAVLSALHPGDRITAEILVSPGSDDYRLASIVVTARAAAVPAAAPVRPLQPGDPAPDFPLVNQDGKTIHLTDQRNRALLVTFIYTRCPLPTACPLITSHFARVNKALLAAPKVRAATHLVSITLDPAYDTPAVLRNYGLAYLNNDPAGFAHWEFAAAAPADLQHLAAAFGLQYEWQNNQIVHTMQTILIAPDGRVARTWSGSAWDPEEIAATTRDLTVRAHP
jgi:protein SCO1